MLCTKALFFTSKACGKDLIHNESVIMMYSADIEIIPQALLVEKFKSPYMQWNQFFKEFHAELIKKLRTKFG